MSDNPVDNGSFCNMEGPDFSNVETVEINPVPSLGDYMDGMRLANKVADEKT